MDNRTKTFIIFPFLVIIIFILAPHYIPFEKELSEIEKKILNFEPIDLKIHERPRASLSIDSSLFDFTAPDMRRASISGDDSASDPLENDMNLSFIIINDDNRMAIIEDTPVKEGDTIADIKIMKIEHNRVLLKDRTAKWLYLE